jgi:histone-lysine N-methyltransferase SETMAR
MIAESLNIPKTVVLRILKEDLGKRKLCARVVPHSLTPEQREDRVILANTLSRWPMQKENCSNKIITGDETWCFVYDPETKRQTSG